MAVSVATEQRRIRIFLGYASEDEARVRRLYRQLQEAGVKPWMDKEDILPGEDWERSIWRAVRRADFFVACLSGCATTKRGFVQREVKRALTFWEEKLESDIYLVPARLEDCEVPRTLSRLQWVDLFEEGGVRRLLNAIWTGAERRGLPVKEPFPEAVGITDLSASTSDYGTDPYIEMREIDEQREGSVPYSLYAEFPQIIGADERWAKEVNRALKGFATTLILDCRRRYFPSTKPDYSSPSPSASSTGNDLSVSCEVTLFKKNLLSVEFGISTYGAGAAHPIYNIATKNFRLRPTFELRLRDLFGSADYVEVISRLCVEDLTNQLASFYEENRTPTGVRPDVDMEWIRRGAGPEEKNFYAFTLRGDGITFAFAPYKVAGYAVGPLEVCILYAELQEIIDSSGPLAEFL